MGSIVMISVADKLCTREEGEIYFDEEVIEKKFANPQTILGSNSDVCFINAETNR